MAEKSFGQYELFMLINDNRDDAEIIAAALSDCLEAGKSLSWFQAVIPEVRPGVKSDAPWAETARNLLWNKELFEEHQRLAARHEALGRDHPAILGDRFGLRRIWPVILRFLQPMSADLVVAVDEVSNALKRADCSPVSQAVDGIMEKHEFILSRQVVQDKILSPLIDAIAGRSEGGPTEQPSESAGESARPGAEQPEMNMKEIPETDRILKEALGSMREIIVREKDECEKTATSTLTKRRKEAKSVGHVDAPKRMKLGTE